MYFDFDYGLAFIFHLDSNVSSIYTVTKAGVFYNSVIVQVLGFLILRKQPQN